MKTDSRSSAFARMSAMPLLIPRASLMAAVLVGTIVLAGASATLAQDGGESLDIVTQNPGVDATGVIVSNPGESIPCDVLCQGMLADPAGWTDSDGDGLTDADEALYAANPALPDTDNDRLSDGDEVHLYNTVPWNADSDEDHVGDYRELFETGTNPRAADSDRDGYSDGEELDRYFTNPNDYDSYPASQGKRQ